MKRCALVVLLVGCGNDFLTKVDTIEPGVECPNGGLRIQTGSDDNGDGVLGAAEVADSQPICSGGVASLTDVTEEPAGANCVAGGARVDTGFDVNGNQVLDTDEVTSTDYICSASGATVVEGFLAADEFPVISTIPATAFSLPIDIPGPGQLLTFTTATAFCTLGECPVPPSGPAAAGYVWQSDVDTEALPPASSSRAQFYLSPRVDEVMSFNAARAVPAAGTATTYLRAANQTTIGVYSLYYIRMTHVFLPD